MVFNPNPAAGGTRAGPVIAGALLIGIFAVMAGLYVKRGGSRNAEVAGASCAGAREVAGRLAPLATGEVAALKVAATPQPATPVAFNAPDGQRLTLADFRGRAILVNLWATWCAPCRAEMPALDKLQGELGGADFEVVAINIDTTRLDRPKAFLTEVGVNRLVQYADPTGAIFADLKKAGKAFGMPTTLLIDRQGCEIGAMAGPAEWASSDAQKLIRELLGR